MRLFSILAGWSARLAGLAIVISCSGSAGAAVATEVDSGSDGPDSSRFVGAADTRTAAEVFGEMVRPTPWLSPRDQLAGFHVPPGFEVRLFASEPEIAKPINIAVDSKGRVWVTQTTAYPTPAADGASPTDAVKILEDTDGDGHADRVTTFADGLNIPIGILPYGEGCLCFSIPNIYYLRDTTGDGVCDTRDVVLGPFDTTRDTHGMVNAMRDGGDGWIYACHGFNNRSVVAGTDGHEVRLESGNTFRFRPDGSRIEQMTQGQVNPFGMTRDEWGYWFSADCHSKPITQLIRGGCYPSFGRADDGLGFLPPTVDHLHGSTAISGIIAIPSDSPIVPLRGQVISGNVMTSRLNRNLLVYRGATARGVELPDFLSSEDSWFRPVDLQIDGSGNIYVADFYNKIIGHYEVPLDHPDRDRTSGRIWQIRYVGGEAGVAGDATKASIAIPESAAQIAAALGDASPRSRVEMLGRLAAIDHWSDEVRGVVVGLLGHDNAHVARAAAEAIGLVDTDDSDTIALLDRLVGVGEDDPVLRQSIRIAVRNRLARRGSDAPIWRRLSTDQLAARRDETVSILLAIDGERVVAPILSYLGFEPNAPSRRELLRHAATHADESTFDSVVELAKRLTGDSAEQQGEMLRSLVASQSKFRDPSKSSDQLRVWALDLAMESLGRFRKTVADGRHLLGWSTNDGKPWATEKRPLGGGGEGVLQSSITRGETYVGVLMSDPFAAPKSIRFRLSGHGGPPDTDDHGKNVVRLVRAADGAILRETLTPRNDTATAVVWKLDDVVGTPVRIECHDGDSGNAYAWLAVGLFEPEWIDPSAGLDQLKMALQWATQLKLGEMDEPLRASLRGDSLSASIRLEIAAAIAEVRRQNDWVAAITGCQINPQLASVSDDVLSLFLDGKLLSDAIADDASQGDAVLRACHLISSHLSSKEELAFAQNWIRRGADGIKLIEMCEAGWFNPRVLTDPELAEVLRSRLDGAAQERLRVVTADLPAVDPEEGRIQQEWLDKIASITADAAAGAEVYTRHCAACHQFRGAGSLVGPQLDGVTTRTNVRLVEDITMPDRNVDAAFRTTSLLLDDGRVIVGMIQTEDDTEIRLADPTGKVLVVGVDSVETRIESNRSLMPGNFTETLTAADLANLFAFLRKDQSRQAGQASVEITP
jgi:putative heme-binding domain-containing protein